MQPAVKKGFHLLMVVTCFVLLFYMTYSLVFARSEAEWLVTVVDQPIRANHTVDLQVFVTDEVYEGVMDATVKGYFSHEKGEVTATFHHVEEGLYEAEALFPHDGEWDGEIRVSSWQEETVHPVSLSVEAAAR